MSNANKSLGETELDALIHSYSGYPRTLCALRELKALRENAACDHTLMRAFQQTIEEMRQELEVLREKYLWIPVNERLPGNGAVVLLHIRNEAGKHRVIRASRFDKHADRLAAQSSVTCSIASDVQEAEQHGTGALPAERVRRGSVEAVGRFTADYIASVTKELESRGWQPDSRGDAECVDEARLTAAQQRIAELERDLENEQARGIHSCYDQCQRPLCVANRRIRDLEHQLAVRSVS